MWTVPFKVDRLITTSVQLSARVGQKANTQAHRKPRFPALKQQLMKKGALRRRGVPSFVGSKWQPRGWGQPQLQNHWNKIGPVRLSRFFVQLEGKRKRFDAVASGLLCPVEGGVGALQQGFEGGVQVATGDAHAHAYRDRECARRRDDRVPGNQTSDFVGAPCGGVQVAA